MKTPESLTGIIRQLLGCEQKLMAESLGMSRAMLSKIENGERSLPPKHLMKVVAVYQALQNMPPPDPAKRETPATNGPGNATKLWIGNMTWRLELARKHAAKTLELHTAAQEALYRVEQLQQRPENQEEGMRLWLNVLWTHAKRKLSTHDAEGIFLANLKVKVLEAALSVMAAEGLENPLADQLNAIVR